MTATTQAGDVVPAPFSQLVGGLMAAPKREAAQTAPIPAEAATDSLFDPIPCFLCAGTGQLAQGLYPYKITFPDGIEKEVLSNLPPDKLLRHVSDVRKVDGFLLWEDGQITKAIKVDHLAILSPGDDEEEEDAGSGESPEGGAEASVEGGAGNG